MTIAQVYNEDFASQFARWLVVLMPSVIITATLIVLMQRLISIEMAEPEETETVSFEPLSYEPKKIETRLEEKPPEPQEVLEPPEAPPKPNLELAEVDIAIPSMKVASVDPEINFNNSLGSVPVAAYLVTAKYPYSALNKGIEGYVDLRFDVNKMGGTENIQVTGANPQGVFEKAAVAAVERWRYQPKMEDGQAQYFSGVTNRITFQIQK